MEFPEIHARPCGWAFKAQELGYHPEVILSGRRINDNMGKWVAEITVKQLIKTGKNVNGARVNVLGITFKEDVPVCEDVRWR
jgi:UDP-N-acetyl-D-galactosamine dehydrogenase